MINQTKIDQAVQEICRTIESNTVTNQRISAYVHDNEVIQNYIFSKTRYFSSLDKTKTAKTQNVELIASAWAFLIFTLIGIFVFSDNRFLYSLIAVSIFMLILGLSFYPRFRRKDVTRDLIQSISTLETVSETTRSYVTKLLEQLPSDTNPYLILQTIYDRDIAIYDDVDDVKEAYHGDSV